MITSNKRLASSVIYKINQETAETLNGPIYGLNLEGRLMVYKQVLYFVINSLIKHRILCKSKEWTDILNFLKKKDIEGLKGFIFFSINE